MYKLLITALFPLPILTKLINTCRHGFPSEIHTPNHFIFLMKRNRLWYNTWLFFSLQLMHMITDLVYWARASTISWDKVKSKLWLVSVRFSLFEIHLKLKNYPKIYVRYKHMYLYTQGHSRSSYKRHRIIQSGINLLCVP